METQELVNLLLTSVLPVASAFGALGLSHWLERRRRNQDEELQREASRLAEELRREGAQHDWLADEHRKLVYSAVTLCFDARSELWLAAMGDQTRLPRCGDTFAQFQHGYRRAKVLASKEFDDAMEAGHATLVSVLTAVRPSEAQDYEYAKRLGDAVNKLETFDKEIWGRIVLAARKELKQPLQLGDEVNPLVVKDR